ncbi:MAG TPA: 3'-5' exonuclease, partial [Micavibrio sp.]
EIVQAAGEKWQEVPMEISFRSTAVVLDFTDEVFRADPVRYGVSENMLQHSSFRSGHAGHIEQWPLFRVPKAENRKDRDEWCPVLTPVNQTNARALLAQHIAHTIQGWLTHKEILPSKGRAVQPGDIMILVRSRAAMVGHLIRELKARHIPVNGMDRIKLGEHIAVQDMLTVAKFALLPEDDLSLACVLKSPLVNWDDQRLEDVAVARPGTLWQAVQHHAPDVSAWLAAAITQAKAARPYEFFSRLLQTPCPASPVSGLRAMTARLSAEARDPLDEFLNQVLGFEGDHVSSVQGFVLWHAHNEAEIKREQEEAGGMIRIMTVHSSKGLQAPIVILPDTIAMKGSKANRASERLLWPAKTGLAFPFWSPQKESEPQAYVKAREAAQNKDQQEYRRLLYVGLTRAEDRLYIGGAAGEKSFDEGSWYTLTQDAFSRIEGAQKIAFTSAPDIMAALHNADEQHSWVLTTPQKAPQQDKKARDHITLTMPDSADPAWQWVKSPPPQEPSPPRPLIPSQASALDDQDDLPAISPLKAQDNYRFRRGNLTHRLLQFLPERPQADREKLAHAFAQRYGHDLPVSVQQSVVAETLRILNHPDYAALFGPQSRAEVPLTGLINGKLLSGQVDRLLVTAECVHIIDYKTNRPPPHDPADVPALYHAQMRAYRETLSRIYPDHQIKTYLLWTDGPHLMEIMP